MEHFRMNPLMNRAARMAEKLHSEALAAIPINIIITIITSLINAIMQCKLPDPSPTPGKNIQEYVTKRYNAETKRYDPYLVRRMKRQAKLAGMRNHHVLSDVECLAIALESLEQARIGEDETLAAIDQAVADDPLN